MEFVGILKIIKTKKGFEHKAEFTNPKGKLVSFPVPPQARHYSAEAKDGDECRLEYQPPSTIVKCVVAGKEATPPPAKQRQTTQPQRPQASSAPRGGNFSANAPTTHNNPGKKLFYGTAPYNFVPYKPGAIARPRLDEERRWSGEIICSLKALTPLLVAGPRERQASGKAECTFMKVNGNPVIPGTSIKGMLRSLMEILSFSGLRPMNRKKLFWRNVTGEIYRQNFPVDPLGGYLRQNGADFTLQPVNVRGTPHVDERAGNPAPAGHERVRTGGMMTKTGPSKDYFFEMAAAGKTDDLGDERREIVMRFWRQLTPNQESKKRWHPDARRLRLAKAPGLPVFYREDDQGRVAELGFCRYFRLEYHCSAWQLAWPEGTDPESADIAHAIFGKVGKESRAGRIAVEPFALSGQPWGDGGVDVVLGEPKPTCVPFYLVQNPQKIRLIPRGTQNDRTSMANYNDPDSRLRGRKLYWHHDVDEQYFPRGNANEKTISRLHPLAKGASGEFRIRISRLTDTELGCLFEALELRPGCAHKLGMGRSLGFGSVEIEIKAANVVDEQERHSSLAARLAAAPAPMDAEKREGLRRIFRDYVYGQISKEWEGEDFYSLQPIRDLFLMLDWKRRPKPGAVATMELGEFRKNPLLPTPEQVLSGRF